jgi:hypothetical protein
VIDHEPTDINKPHDYYYDENNHINIDTYRAMLNTNVDILTSSLNKSMHTSNKLPLSLMQRFTIKHSKELI